MPQNKARRTDIWFGWRSDLRRRRSHNKAFILYANKFMWHHRIILVGSFKWNTKKSDVWGIFCTTKIIINSGKYIRNTCRIFNNFLKLDDSLTFSFQYLITYYVRHYVVSGLNLTLVVSKSKEENLHSACFSNFWLNNWIKMLLVTYRSLRKSNLMRVQIRNRIEIVLHL